MNCWKFINIFPHENFALYGTLIVLMVYLGLYMILLILRALLIEWLIGRQLKLLIIMYESQFRGERLLRQHLHRKYLLASMQLSME